MPLYQGASTKPYAVVWMGRIAILQGRSGTSSVHTSLMLARKAAIRRRDELRPMWGATQPWFLFQVVDRRTGEVLGAIH